VTDTEARVPDGLAGGSAGVAYPPHWEADVVAADGGTVHIRPIMPEDAAAIVAFHGGLSAETRYLRYFSPFPRIPAKELHRLVNVDHVNRVALVGLLGKEIIAVGRWDRLDNADEAEVAFVVADAHQGRGIATILLEHLAAAGRERNIRRFTAEVLNHNPRMLTVFNDAGYQSTHAVDHGIVHLEFDIDETAVTEAVALEREQSAEAASMRRLLAPATVAVIGASADPAKLGNAVVRNLLRHEFRGAIYPVNPTARAIEGIPAYPQITDIPAAVDLAVIAAPAATVPDIVAQCVAKQVRGLVIISGGFAERPDDPEGGLAAQRALVAEAHANGMRVIGPNCLGIANNDPDVQLNASLAPLVPRRGRTGFFCQSGALGVAVLGEAVRRDVGLSTFVSAGNRADVSGNDLLQYWGTDPDTDVILLYLESFGNPRKFAQLVRRVGRTKPIVAVKSEPGRMVKGLAHSSVHLDEVSLRSLFEASGVIRVETLDGMFDIGLLLAAQPLPMGNRVAVVGNSSALNVLATAACAAEGLEAVRSVDVGPNVTAEAFGAALAGAARAEDVDALVAVFVPALLRTSGAEYAEALRAAVRGVDKPVLSTFLGFDGVPAELREPGTLLPTRGSIPSYPSPERAVRTLAHAVRHAEWRRRPPGFYVDLPGIDPEPARRVVEHVLATSEGGRWLDDDELDRVLSPFGLGMVPLREVVGPWEARAAAVTLGWPVALRLPSLTPGAVRLYLGDEHALADAWHDLGLGEDSRAVVQAMAPRGVDVVFGVQEDLSFGALVSFGIGGVATELLDDRAYAAVPLSSQDAYDLVRAPRAAAMLTGYRGAVAADLDRVADVALRLSRLADDLPEVAELRVGAIAGPDVTAMLWAQVRVAPPRSRVHGPRRLISF
jgi:acyl-CoA synthetase (NDP forming)/GNAT superfamily N-acetyltransferase